MESSSVPLHHQDCSMHQTCTTLYQCGYLSSEGYSSLSPASSIDCCCLSPPYLHYPSSQEAYVNISSSCPHTIAQPKTSLEKKSKKMKGKLPYGQRQSASEREKMRMRNLSKALQNLRRYLPPSVAPADKTLTKIETLQLTILYISHLSAQLGLSEDVLKQRRLTTMQRTNRCPQGLNFCMDMTHPLCSEPIEENIIHFAASAEPIAATRPMPVESGLQNTHTSYQLQYELPPLTPLHQYPTTSTALSQITNEYDVTGHQQMVTCEEYTNLVEMWRKEQSHA
ncbi:mesoderm posterior protein 1 [Pseudophryne corroboree]|uniref:mesoderm posterior protein 1 n=1 Tax=Pseudophryne corroboree TaxID=495146 RepID=UPI0030820D0B